MITFLFYTRFWFALFFPCVCGFVFLKGTMGKNLSRLPPLLVAALSFLLGLGILPVSMLMAGWVGIKFTVAGMSVSAIGLTLFIVSCLRIFKIYPAQELRDYGAADDLPRNHFLYWGVRVFFVFYVSLIALIVLFTTFAAPLLWFDTIATAGFQAKVFFYSRSLAFHPHVPLASYPQQIPLLLTWMSVNLGSWDPILLKAFFPLNFFAGCVVFYYVIKKFLGKTVGLFGVILFFSSPFLSYSATVAYRDVFLMNYICIAFSLLFFWYYDDNRWMLFLSGIFAGLATFTKSESLLYVLIYGVSFLALVFKKGGVKQNRSLFFYFVIPVGFLVSLYLLYKFQRGILLNEKGGVEFSLQRLSAVADVLTRFAVDLFVKPNWGFVVFWFVLSLAIHIKKLLLGTPGVFFVRVTMLFFAAVFCIAVFGTNQNIVQGLISHAGLSRVFLHFFPLIVLGVLFLNFERE